MPTVAVTAALGASLCWALGSLMAHRPATQLGAFEFTRRQLLSSFALLTGNPRTKALHGARREGALRTAEINRRR
jgi:drug/metabolite transporter (DMT)-like permease